MANRYWVGGTAAWDGTAGTKWALTSGGAGGQAVPTAADDVFFDAASGAVTCTITGARVAKSINCTGFTGTLAGASTPSLTISGSLTLVAGMTLTFAGSILFNATGTLTSGGKTLGATTINGSGITVTLGDNLNIGTNNLTVTQGTFTTSASNYSITAGGINSSNSNTRTINLNGSTVNLSGSKPFLFATTTNLTFNAGTSQVNLTGSSPDIESTAQTFYNVSFTNTALSSASITGANTFNNLTFAARAAAGIADLRLSANQTINGTFTVQSGATDPAIRLFIVSGVPGTARTITSASNSLFGVDFQDITGAGTASWNDSSRTGYWGDCKGNSGITFATGRTVYWNLAGTQNWSATGWTDTSTGTPDAQYFPLVQDTATFTNAGAAGTILTGGYNIGTLDMSGRTSAMTLRGGPTVYGDWTNGSGITQDSIGTITFSGRNTQTITSAGVPFSASIEIDSLSGTVQLADSFVCNSGVSAGVFLITSGTFNTQNNNVTCSTFRTSGSAAKTITLGSSTFTVTQPATSWNLSTTAGLTFNANTSNIVLSNTSTSARTFEGGGLTYNKVTIGGTTGTSTTTINGANTFGELASTKTVAHTITFSADQTITTWSVAGSSGNVVTVNSTAAGSARTLTITNRTSGIDWLDVRDITAPLAPVTFYAGANSLIRPNTLGVAAIAPTAGEFIYVLTTGTSWDVPADWDNANNEIHLFGGGGGGKGGVGSSGSGFGGGGGGGGGYTKLVNVQLTRRGTVSYAIGAAGARGAVGGNGTAGGTTTFFAGTTTALGGAGGSSVTGAAGGVGSTATGGNGGNGITLSGSTAGRGGGGGGGAGGPLGNGGNGGNGSGDTVATGNRRGGGGGGNGGGSNGGNATASPLAYGVGGNNNAGVGGGAVSAVGFNGGGSGGSSTGLSGSSGTDIAKAGFGGGGGGGGGGGTGTQLNAGGFFGGGGGGSDGVGLSSTTASNGGQGGIVIVYSSLVTPPTVTTGDFFFLIG